MPCEKPHTAYQGHFGGPILFTKPIEGMGGKYHTLKIPCGICILCQEEKARQWAVRIHHEAHQHERNAFITLTYSDDKLPEWCSLDYAQLQKFWKRVKQHLIRKAQLKLRYYACGEYGDETQRPHYHACIFGYDFMEDAELIRDGQQKLWTSPTLEQLWGQGNVSIGVLNFKTARYTASYVTKKLRSKQQYVRVDQETGELIPLEQPRGFMSRNLGRAWWNNYRHQVSAHDYVIIDGRKQKPPQAYDRWLKEKSEIAHNMIKEQRLEKAKPESKEQTRARARNAHARTKAKSKKL